MGYMMAIGTCANCRVPITFNPEWVPSVRIDASGHPDPEAPRRPVCRACALELYRLLRDAGLTPPPIHPMAYEPEECP